MLSPPQPICRFGKANLQKRTQSADSKPICRLGEANLQKRTQSADSTRICRLTGINLQIRRRQSCIDFRQATNLQIGGGNLQKRTQSADSKRICRLTAVNLQIRNQSADRNPPVLVQRLAAGLDAGLGTNWQAGCGFWLPAAKLDARSGCRLPDLQGPSPTPHPSQTPAPTPWTFPLPNQVQ